MGLGGNNSCHNSNFCCDDNISFTHELAADPYSIEKIVKVNLPDITSVQTMDDLGGSRWDMFVHEGRFTEEISEKSIQKMDELCQSDTIHWSKNSDKVVYMILLTWGIILFIVSLFRRNPKKS